MEEKGKGINAHTFRVRDEKEFFDFIEQRYKEQGFILLEDTTSVRYAQEDAEYYGVFYEDEELQYEQGGFEGLEKIFVF
jgi:hypothetical protein